MTILIQLKVFMAETPSLQNTPDPVAMYFISYEKLLWIYVIHCMCNQVLNIKSS